MMDFAQFPTDPKCIGVNDQYLLGPSLLVAPVVVRVRYSLL